LEYEPEAWSRTWATSSTSWRTGAERDLERFRAFIESEGYATGAWRGSISEGAQVGTPGLDQAGESRGDSGKTDGEDTAYQVLTRLLAR
jgi:hypothetical protein